MMHSLSAFAGGGTCTTTGSAQHGEPHAGKGHNSKRVKLEAEALESSGSMAKPQQRSTGHGRRS